MPENINNSISHSTIIGALLVFLMIIIGIAAVPGWLDQHKTEKLVRQWIIAVLIEAKAAEPEMGKYDGMIPAEDIWGLPLYSVLVVEELANSVTVTSSGKDTILDTDDDISFSKTDIHVRKTIAKGLQEGSRNVGKGLAKGVIEGIGEATNGAKDKATKGLKKAKSSLMAHFRKTDESPSTKGSDREGTRPEGEGNND